MPPNILLVVLDGLRAANTSLVDHDRDTTPALADFATSATVYESAYAPSNWSLPSHASLFTGYEVPEHRVMVQYDALTGQTIWGRLRDKHGYATGLFSQNEFLTADEFGLNRGFETVVGPVSTRWYPFPSAQTPVADPSQHDALADWSTLSLREPHLVQSFLNHAVDATRQVEYHFRERIGWAPSLSVGPQYRSPARTHADRFLDWSDATERPWAACLNIMDANLLHTPWPTPTTWDSTYQEQILADLDDLQWDFYAGRQPWWKLQALEPRYDVGVRRADTELSRVLSGLSQRGELDETLVVITADHGEGLGERSRVRSEFRVASHTLGVHESLLHVPLVVKNPLQDSGTTVTTPVSLTRFPAVVKASVDGETVSFQSEDPVIAAANHDRLYEYVMSQEEWRIGPYLDVLDEAIFSDTARVVYRKQDGHIRKHATWGDNAATIRILGPVTSERLKIGGRTIVEEVFDQFSDADVKSTYKDPDAVSESTLQRLRELGYT